MRITHAAVWLLLLVVAGCAPVTPDASVPKASNLATQPDTPQPAATSSAPVTLQPAPSSAPAPALRARAPQAATGAAPPPVAKTPAVAQPLDLNALEVQLKETKAIGVFTKISLKNKVDDLMGQFRNYYRGKPTPTMTDLRRSYDLLMMKVLSLLQDADQKLASAIVLSREAIWALLADPKTFATIQG